MTLTRTPPWLLLVLPLLPAGCTALAGPDPWPAASALGADLTVYRPAASRPTGAGRARAAEPTGTLTLRRALAAALMNNPGLRASAWAVRAREAEGLQAGRLPNPELEVTAEDFGVSGQLRGARAMELTIAVRQAIWLGGQRARRTRLGALESREAGWAYELARLAVLTRTAQAFIAVVAAQELETLVREEVTLLGKVVALFRERAEAGRIARQDLGRVRAELQLARARLKGQQQRRQLAVARQQLAARWGGLEARFGRAEGRLDGPVALPDLRGLLARIHRSPQVKAWQARLSTRQAAVALSAAGAIPSLTVTGGVRVLPESGDLGFVVGLSIPLPLFDRQQGATSAARFRVAETRERLRAARVKIASLITAAHERAAAAALTLGRIETAILPQAQAGVTAALDAYREGKAGHLVVLDAQRTLVQLRAERLAAQAGLLVALAELELLLGEPLDPPAKAPSHERPRRVPQRRVPQP